jgi:hypothetical protein
MCGLSKSTIAVSDSYDQRHVPVAMHYFGTGIACSISAHNGSGACLVGCCLEKIAVAMIGQEPWIVADKHEK